MKSIILLSFKRIFRTNRIVLLFIFLAYIALFYIALYTKDFKSFMININLALSYGCLLITGGQLKDEISNGYLEVILHKISRAKIFMGKYLSVFSFACICYLFILINLLICFLLYGNFEESKLLFSIMGKGFIVTVYLISLGLFLSLYFKGYFNFVFVFFGEFATLVLMEHLNVLDRLDKISSFNFLIVSLFSPHLNYSRTNIFVIFGLFIFSIIFIFLTMYFFKKMELLKG